MSDQFIEMQEYYKSLYKKFGYSPDALGWSKGNQFLRFYQLTNQWDLNNSSILDIGCGFGDFNKYLDANRISEYNYLGIDILEEFILEARKQYLQNNIEFIEGEFLTTDFDKKVDFSIASGTFNVKIKGVDCYDYIYANMKKMLELSNKAIAIDLLTDRVDYSHEHNFNYNPMKILEMAYSLSKRVLLNNSCFPFEFAIIIFKDDDFQKDTMHFNMK
jgi:SAM-dependent methyltransferase